MSTLWADIHAWQSQRLARRMISPTTSRRQTQRLQRFTEFIAGTYGPDIGMNDVTEPMFEAWLVDLSTADSSYGRPYEPSTINQMASPVRAFFAAMCRRGRVAVDPCIDVPRIPEDPPHPRSLTPEALARLIAGCHGPNEFRDRTLIMTAALTGMRASELAQMRVEGWDRANHSTTIRRAKSRKIQTIFLCPQLEEELGAWVRWGMGNPSQGPMWPGEKGDPLGLRPGTIGAIVRHVAADVDVRANLHAMRHTFVYSMLRQGVPANVVQAAAGHASLATTGRYATAHDHDVAAAVRSQERI